MALIAGSAPSATHGRIGSDPRAGAALVAVVLVTTALALLAHGLLLAARTQSLMLHWDASRSGSLHSRTALVTRSAASLDSLPSGPGLPGPELVRRWTGLFGSTPPTADLWSLSPEVALVTSSDPHFPGASPVTVALWAPAPEYRIRVRRGSVQSPRLLVWPGAISHADTTLGRCSPGRNQRLHGLSESEVGPGRQMATGSLQDPNGTGIPPGADHIPVLGPLSIHDLLTRLGAAAASSTPTPASAVPPRAPWIVADTLTGFIVHTEDVEIAAGGSVAGWLIGGGTVRIRAGGQVAGWVDALGSVTVDAGGALLGDPCLAAASLARTLELRRPWRLGPPAWPQF